MLGGLPAQRKPIPSSTSSSSQLLRTWQAKAAQERDLITKFNTQPLTHNMTCSLGWMDARNSKRVIQDKQRFDKFIHEPTFANNAKNP